MGLGINKDLEPLARRVRRLGGAVTMTGSNHVRWDLPGGTTFFTGLTMSATSAQTARRRIERHLAALDAVPPAYAVQASGTGKYVVVASATGEPVANAAGYPRTFSAEKDARREARRLSALTAAPTG